jgi:3,4-dihydroxy 2-butanone 4-phosphate synthase/GTP cyclohydrolase II
VFPLVARDGGVLVRAGHTEAAVDVSRLAGLNPSGVICEIMNDDGSMARLPDLVVFAQTHGLKIGAIEDLISYRRRTEKQVEAVVDGAFESTYGGRFRLLIYRNLLDQTEHVVLMKGRVDPSRPTLVRMHRVDVFSDLMGLAAGREDYVEQALRSIAAHDGPGIVVLIRDPRPDSLTARVADYRQAVDPTPGIVRDYGVGAQILADLGVEDMILMSNSKSILPASAGYGLKVIDQVPLVARGVGSPGGQSGTSDSGGAGARVRLVNGGR